MTAIDQAPLAFAIGWVLARRFFPFAEGFLPGINTPTELKDGVKLRGRFAPDVFASLSECSFTK